ncbi:MAG: FAD-binding protein [Chloroflexi bacterium]|nr:FAD-binding protein [Chloroflexota bacterium]
MRLRPTHIHHCDVLVVGGGLAGCMAAITAKLSGAERVILVDKARVSRSGQSPFAAGIWAIRLADDNLDLWVEETISSGDYWNDQDWVRLLWERSEQTALKVEVWGAEFGEVVFERDEQRKLIRRKSRGHYHTWHALFNSMPMMESLRRKARNVGVELFERTMITHLIVQDSQKAALGFEYRKGTFPLFQPKASVLASSGCSFKSVAKFAGGNLTGDLQAAAYRAGVFLRNMENIDLQHGPKHYTVHGKNLYVSVGGKLVNSNGEEFMWEYDPLLGNRANQPTMALAIAREVHEGRGPVFMDMTSASSEDRELCRRMLPDAFKVWDAAGIEPFRQPIEWASLFYGTVAQGGGIHIDTRCATNVDGIFAAGDVTCLPPHGGYSFGGVNIAFCAVSGEVAGECAADYARSYAEPNRDTEALALRAGELIGENLRPLNSASHHYPAEAIRKIQEALIPYRVSIIKSRERLEQALEQITSVQVKMTDMRARNVHELTESIEAKNIALLAQIAIRASLERRESRGFHFREDYPVIDNREWLKWLFVKRGEDGPEMWTEGIPTPYLKPPEAYARPRGFRRNVQA